MNNSMILIKKECVQMLRDFKIIWLPIVFIFLGATQPIVTHYLPSILGALGGGQGITIDSSMAAQKEAKYWRVLWVLSLISSDL